MLIFVDAEKAFDRIEWEFLFLLLQKMDIGSFFFQWIKLIYFQQRSKNQCAGLQSSYFVIQRWVRQGCLLSPLLFNLVIESLCLAMIQCPQINGIQIGSVKHKISLYADDITFFLQAPLQYIAVLMIIAQHFPLPLAIK